MSSCITAGLPRAHAEAFRALAHAMQAVDEAEPLPCSLSPESYWPGRGELFYPNRDAALSSCQRCPVRAECEAMGPHERRGIWGGHIFVAGRAVA